jgi:hypothetical protein
MNSTAAVQNLAPEVPQKIATFQSKRAKIASKPSPGDRPALCMWGFVGVFPLGWPKNTEKGVQNHSIQASNAHKPPQFSHALTLMVRPSSLHKKVC